MNALKNVLETRLAGEHLDAALQFAAYLEERGLRLSKDQSLFWREKQYYHVTYRDAFVCYLSIADPDDPDHAWTVYSVNSPSYASAEVTDAVRETGWRYVDFCRYCGSCGGGRPRTVFGRRFDEVCGCTFRVDDAGTAELPFLREMVRLRMEDIDQKAKSL
ncbi:MAG: hypothetical protein E7458_09355 [Ruminococcaceae bacterium]|nr:hypothetical protein [Oscillospiraceae bacterium]